MTDDMTRRSGDDERLDDAAERGPVTEGLDLSDPAAGDPERIRKMPEEGVDAEARSGETWRVAPGDEGGAVDEGDPAAMPTEPAGGTH